VPEIIVIASRFGKRQCKKLAQVVLTTGGELYVRFGGSAHIHLFAGSGALRPQRNSVGAIQQFCSQVSDALGPDKLDIRASDTSSRYLGKRAAKGLQDSCYLLDLPATAITKIARLVRRLGKLLRR